MKNWAAIVLTILPQILFGQISSYKYYREDSTVRCEIIQLDSIIDAHRRIVYYHENGKKAHEFFDKNRVPYDTLFRWNELGIVTYMEIYSDSGYIQLDYFKNGALRETGKWILTKPQLYDLVIYDSTNWDKYEAADCPHPCFHRSGIWKTYYENGELRSEGKYLPMEFNIGYPSEKDSTGVYQLIPKTSFDMIPGLIYIGCVTYLRDGNWVFYTQDGKIEEEIHFVNGLPVKK